MNGSKDNVLYCTAGRNKGIGIAVFDGCLVADCVSGDNGADGIDAEFGDTVRGCVTRSNAANGILANAGCLLIDKVCDQNGQATAGLFSGIYLSGDHNRVEGNSTTFNNGGFGVKANGHNNLIFRNTASGNTAANYVFTSNHRWGAIVDLTGTTSAFTGNATPSNASTTERPRLLLPNW